MHHHRRRRRHYHHHHHHHHHNHHTTTTAAAAAATNLGAAVKKASLLSEGRSLATEATPASTADSFSAQLAVSSDAYSAAVSTERACILSEVFAKAPRSCGGFKRTTGCLM